MNFIESIERIYLKARESDLSIKEGNEFNPNLCLIMPRVKEYYGNQTQALYLCCGTDASGTNAYIKEFVKRLDCINDEIIYSKSLLKTVKRKYDLIIALDACEPLRKKSKAKKERKEKTLINNIKKLLFKEGAVLFEDDASNELLHEFKTSVIGNKFKIIIAIKN